MTRVEFLEPIGGLTPQVVSDTLLMAPHLPQATSSQLAELSHHELLLIYDYAMREVLRASDNVTVRRRDMPAVLRWVSVRPTAEVDDRWRWFSELTAEQQRHAYLGDQEVIRQQAKWNAELQVRLSRLGGDSG